MLSPAAATQVARIGGELEAVLRAHQMRRRALACRELAELQSVRWTLWWCLCCLVELAP